MSSFDVTELPDITEDQILQVSRMLGLPDHAFLGKDGKDTRREVLESLASLDICACPGSGKTTLLVAKLAILGSRWPHTTSGMCVLSHTNVARYEIERRVGQSLVGHRLLSYPHFIGTIQAFVDDR